MMIDLIMEHTLGRFYEMASSETPKEEFVCKWII